MRRAESNRPQVWPLRRDKQVVIWRRDICSACTPHVLKVESNCKPWCIMWAYPKTTKAILATIVIPLVPYSQFSLTKVAVHVKQVYALKSFWWVKQPIILLRRSWFLNYCKMILAYCNHNGLTFSTVRRRRDRLKCLLLRVGRYRSHRPVVGVVLVLTLCIIRHAVTFVNTFFQKISKKFYNIRFYVVYDIKYFLRLASIIYTIAQNVLYNTILCYRLACHVVTIAQLYNIIICYRLTTPVYTLQ